VRRSAIISADPPNVASPLSISTDGRYFVDPSNQPVLVKGDTAWSLFNQISLADARLYIDDTATRGFNTLLVSIIEDFYSDNTPAEVNVNGDNPFNPINDFASPNEAYWQHVDAVVLYAKNLGITFFCVPSYIGFSNDGWAAELDAATQADLISYGEFLGARYASYGNFIWLGGGDRALDNPVEDRAKQVAWVEDVMSGIISQWPTNAPWGIHTSLDEDHRAKYGADFSWMNIAGVYTYNDTAGAAYTLANAFYNDTPAWPVYFQEGNYESSSGVTEKFTRTQTWQSVLGGATAGYIFGNHSIWAFGAQPAKFYSTYTLSEFQDWKGKLDTVGRQGAATAGEILESVSWYLLVPDDAATVITSALGTGDNRIVCAICSDDSAALAYVPTATNPTVDMSEFTGTVVVDWIDPITGGVTSDNSYAASGSQTITHPGNNSDGEADWVLRMIST